MGRRMRVKPSKFNSAIGFTVSLVFSIIGIGLLIGFRNNSIFIFFLVWTLIAFIQTAFYGINLFTKKGISLYSVTIEDDKEQKKDK